MKKFFFALLMLLTLKPTQAVEPTKAPTSEIETIALLAIVGIRAYSNSVVKESIPSDTGATEKKALEYLGTHLLTNFIVNELVGQFNAK